MALFYLLIFWPIEHRTKQVDILYFQLLIHPLPPTARDRRVIFFTSNFALRVPNLDIPALSIIFFKKNTLNSSNGILRSFIAVARNHLPPGGLVYKDVFVCV